MSSAYTSNPVFNPFYIARLLKRGPDFFETDEGIELRISGGFGAGAQSALDSGSAEHYLRDRFSEALHGTLLREVINFENGATDEVAQLSAWNDVRQEVVYGYQMKKEGVERFRDTAIKAAQYLCGGLDQYEALLQNFCERRVAENPGIAVCFENLETELFDQEIDKAAEACHFMIDHPEI